AVIESGGQYKAPRSKYGPHRGIDIGQKYGPDIFAVKSGRVSVAGPNASYGKYISIDHPKDAKGNEVQTVYAHNSRLKVKKGDTVKKGEIISTMGNTGDSFGVHLHFEVRINGNHKNPKVYLP
ncbi:MAG: M23 family metallopeptidase, partial [Anaerovoracaceae bacterium]